MGLETGDLISNLDILWPLEIDPTHQGNEHLQLIKRVIQKTFPGRDAQGVEEGGWDARTLVNPEELDLLIDATTPIKDTQNLIKLDNGKVVVGLDDNTTPMDIHTSTRDGIVHRFDVDTVATIMNSLNVVDLIYPVDSYIERGGGAPDPNVQYSGTTWVPVIGYVTLGAGIWDEGGPDEVTYVVDETGGALKHILTVDEMPAHAHASGSRQKITSSPDQGNARKEDAAGVDGETVGGGQGHSNMQPYVVVNKWKRTA